MTETIHTTINFLAYASLIAFLAIGVITTYCALTKMSEKNDELEKQEREERIAWKNRKDRS